MSLEYLDKLKKGSSKIRENVMNRVNEVKKISCIYQKLAKTYLRQKLKFLVCRSYIAIAFNENIMGLVIKPTFTLVLISYG